MGAPQVRSVSLAERAHALCAAVQKLPPSAQQHAVSVQATQLALMLNAESSPAAQDRWRLELRLGFDRDDAPGIEHCAIAVEGSRVDIERLKARIGYWQRLEQHAAGERRQG